MWIPVGPWRTVGQAAHPIGVIAKQLGVVPVQAGGRPGDQLHALTVDGVCKSLEPRFAAEGSGHVQAGDGALARPGGPLPIKALPDRVEHHYLAAQPPHVRQKRDIVLEPAAVRAGGMEADRGQERRLFQTRQRAVLALDRVEGPGRLVLQLKARQRSTPGKDAAAGNGLDLCGRCEGVMREVAYAVVSAAFFRPGLHVGQSIEKAQQHAYAAAGLEIEARRGEEGDHQLRWCARR